MTPYKTPGNSDDASDLRGGNTNCCWKLTIAHASHVHASHVSSEDSMSRPGHRAFKARPADCADMRDDLVHLRLWICDGRNSGKIDAPRPACATELPGQGEAELEKSNERAVHVWWAERIDCDIHTQNLSVIDVPIILHRPTSSLSRTVFGSSTFWWAAALERPL